MNPSHQKSSILNTLIRERKSIQTLNVEPRIETTQYNANTTVSAQGVNTGFQTVSFEQKANLQNTYFFKTFKEVFKNVIKDDYFELRPDFEDTFSSFRNSKTLTFDPSNLLGDKRNKFHYCEVHKLDRDNIAYKIVNGKTQFFENICSICQGPRNLSERGYTVEHFSAILNKKKQEIFSLEFEQFNHESNCENIWQNLKSLILRSAVKAVDYTKNFQSDFFNLVGRNRFTQEDVESIKSVIEFTIKKNKNLDYTNIGERPELRKQYISLAIFLISRCNINFTELEVLLKKYIFEIYTIRQETLNCHTDWLTQLVAYYRAICLEGKLIVDNTFLSTININLFGETRIEYRESSEWMLKYNELLIQYNTEIQNLNLTIINLRNNVPTNLQIQEVN
jgi:hypothetical protein